MSIPIHSSDVLFSFILSLKSFLFRNKITSDAFLHTFCENYFFFINCLFLELHFFKRWKQMGLQQFSQNDFVKSELIKVDSMLFKCTLTSLKEDKEEEEGREEMQYKTKFPNLVFKIRIRCRCYWVFIALLQRKFLFYCKSYQTFLVWLLRIRQL